MRHGRRHACRGAARWALGLCAWLAIGSTGRAQRAARPAPDDAPPKRKPDLGDTAQGTYRGEIISDSRGTSSEPGASVTVTIERIGVNRVRVTTDTPQLPGAEIRLTSAMGRVMQASGNHTLLLDPTQRPMKIDYSWEQTVSFSGSRM